MHLKRSFHHFTEACLAGSGAIKHMCLATTALRLWTGIEGQARTIVAHRLSTHQAYVPPPRNNLGSPINSSECLTTYAICTDMPRCLSPRTHPPLALCGRGLCSKQLCGVSERGTVAEGDFQGLQATKLCGSAALAHGTFALLA